MMMMMKIFSKIQLALKIITNDEKVLLTFGRVLPVDVWLSIGIVLISIKYFFYAMCEKNYFNSYTQYSNIASTTAAKVIE